MQERIDSLDFQPVYEAYTEYTLARASFTVWVIFFYTVLAVLWLYAHFRPPMVNSCTFRHFASAPQC